MQRITATLAIVIWPLLLSGVFGFVAHSAAGDTGDFLDDGSSSKSSGSAPDLEKLEKHRCPRPGEFASVFSNGYGSDLVPQEDEKFEALLIKIHEAGFNVVHCSYTEKRLELCKKQGVKMMVDLLVEQHHVFKNPEKAQALCAKLKDNADIWGYNIWNDQFGKTGEGRRRDVNNVRQWDPKHPAFCGTYRTSGMDHLVNADVMGYYDFHWKRGTGQHFPHLLAYSKWGRERDAWYYTWLSTSSGLPGKGNFNRNLYSANTGIACGLKGILWFLGTEMTDGKTQEWTEAGRDIIKVNKEIMPLSKELVKLGNPSAIYSTIITKTLNDEPLPDGKKEMLPPGLENNGFPKDLWIQPVSGEFVMGMFIDDRKKDVVFLANHNAYAEQKVCLKLAKAARVSLFNRNKAKWEALEATDGEYRLQLDPGGGELLRFGE